MSNLIKKSLDYLCPPGNGVYTVHTAKELKDEYHQKLYNTTETNKVELEWKKSLKNLESVKGPVIFGITSDAGGGIQRGANWGPLFIRNSLNLVPYKAFDVGDVRTIPHFLHDKYLNEEAIKSSQDALYGGKNLPVSPLSIAEDFSYEFFKEFPDKKLLSLGGDHSVSYPLVKSWIKAKREQGKKVAIIHFDAHTDLMDKRLGVDICFGSWAYHMIELLEEPGDLMQFGIRSSGKSKDFWTKELGIQQVWANEFKEEGLESIINKTISYLTKRKIDEVYISFDIDFLDATYASATGTPENGGLAPHEGCAVIEAVGEKFNVTGADLVEVAPFVSSYKKDPKTLEPETTIQSAKTIIEKMMEVML